MAMYNQCSHTGSTLRRTLGLAYALLSPPGNSNNFGTNTPHFHVSLDPENSVPDSETSQNLVDNCIRHLLSIVSNSLKLASSSNCG